MTAPSRIFQDNKWSVDRSDSDSLKWARYKGTDILPMWVADMDVRSAEPILQALHQRIDHGVFGYGLPGDDTVQAVIEWLQSRHNWQIHPDWIVWTPGLVTAINVVCRAFAEPGQAVITMTPIYPPFLAAPGLSGRHLVTCPLTNTGGRCTIDFEALQAAITPAAKVLLLCSPHNPVGRVWEKDVLQRLAQICLEKNILLCSDEIHCDLVLDTALRHTPTATLSEEIAANTVTLMSPAKTFNLPGLGCGFAVISNPNLRKAYKAAARDIVPHVNILGYTACRAALTHGQDWLEEVLDHLRENHRLLYAAINKINGLSMAPVEATYLAWIDIRKLNLSNPIAFFQKAGVGLQNGLEFGQPGFVRLNFACSRENLFLAIERIKNAVENC
jgi:cystathionine beta-lyase